MRCLLCSNWSITEHICSTCQNEFLTPNITKEIFYKDIELISFYSYKDIEQLLKLKHTPLGYHVIKILAKLSFTKFAQNFNAESNLSSIAIDDNVESGYSHTAILNKSLKSNSITPQYNVLRQKNNLHYSEHNLSWRKAHPRNFLLKKINTKNIILIDDIKTTGLTLKSAIKVLKERNYDVQFVMTLASVRN